MNAKNTINLPPPPTYLAAFKNGFNAVANHIQVILFPVVLDLLYLFGPQIRITKLLAPVYNEVIQIGQSGQFQQLSNADQAQVLSNLKEFIARINLFSILSTFPFGIPSIFNFISKPGILTNPLGTPLEINLSSYLTTLVLIFLLYLLGLALGVLYYSVIAALSSETQLTGTLRTFFWQYLQILLFCIWLIAMFCIIILPAIFIISLIQIINPLISQIIFFAFIFLLLWLGFPLIFTPHGVFTYHQNIFSAAFTSYRLVRSTLPSAGLFMSMVILVYLLSLGLWILPPEDSWFILAGIVGHAFLFSGLLASTLFYYRGSINWMREIIKRTQNPVSKVI